MLWLLSLDGLCRAQASEASSEKEAGIKNLEMNQESRILKWIKNQEKQSEDSLKM